MLDIVFLLAMMCLLRIWAKNADARLMEKVGHLLMNNLGLL
ncbi:hypothetical protein ACN23B_00600 [Anabaena sp. FACHB-709]|uniref:Uncharacterized protein n=1 Tax=Trichormus variabilis NIES-23 TaxID=1973479 RepID=A0A1Z4KQ17_ANAVA|nr:MULTISPECIES: hypothetical protein [Nostocaceae]BAY71092.1 hypothetical protein NIES23_39060 [Trichormus variabilis NIES-23]